MRNIQYLKDAQHAYQLLQESKRRERALKDAIKAHRDAVLEGDTGEADVALWRSARLRRVA